MTSLRQIRAIFLVFQKTGRYLYWSTYVYNVYLSELLKFCKNVLMPLFILISRFVSSKLTFFSTILFIFPYYNNLFCYSNFYHKSKPCYNLGALAIFHCTIALDQFCENLNLNKRSEMQIPELRRRQEAPRI